MNLKRLIAMQAMGKVQVFNSRGFSYVEILVAVTLIALCLVPAMEALQTGVLGSHLNEAYEVDQLALRSKMEEVLAEPFAALDAAATAAGSITVPTSYSDTITATDGRQITRQVYLDHYDGDGDSVADPDLLFVKVEIDATAYGLETLTSW